MKQKEVGESLKYRKEELDRIWRNIQLIWRIIIVAWRTLIGERALVADFCHRVILCQRQALKAELSGLNEGGLI